MKNKTTNTIEAALQNVSFGELQFNDCYPLKEKTPFLIENMNIASDGKVRMDMYSIYPGVQLIYGWYQGDYANFYHDENHTIVEITYCCKGRVGWDMDNNISIYIGEKDLSMQTSDCCANSKLKFPLGYFEGIHLVIDFDAFLRSSPEPICESHMKAEKLYKTLFPKSLPLVIRDSTTMQQMFETMNHLLKENQIAYLKLKIQEMVLLLDRYDGAESENNCTYPSAQTELIKEIHHKLVSDISNRHTIAELAKEYLINTSSLKEIFKAVYGAPIGAYMKEHRIKTAMGLLRESEDSMADIASAVGYENQSKFTAAFKASTGMSPTNYRKNVK